MWPSVDADAVHAAVSEVALVAVAAVVPTVVVLTTNGMKRKKKGLMYARRFDCWYRQSERGHSFIHSCQSVIFDICKYNHELLAVGGNSGDIEKESENESINTQVEDTPYKREGNLTTCAINRSTMNKPNVMTAKVRHHL